MSSQWYYGYGANRFGPFSEAELKELAAAGRIQFSDTVWKEGVEQGVPATRVKHLFAPADDAPPPAPPAEAVPAPAAGGDRLPDAGASGEGPAPAPTAGSADPAAEAPAPPPKRPVRKARAIAISGVVITSQDGVMAQFKKKCTVCGHEDPNKGRVPIKNGVNRVSFFCTKCRKSRNGEFQGTF